MKVKQCMKITEIRIHLTDAESNLVAECPEKYAQGVEDALNKYDTLKASHTKLVEAIEGAMRINNLWMPGSDMLGDEHKSEAIALTMMMCGFEQVLAEAEKL